MDTYMIDLENRKARATRFLSHHGFELVLQFGQRISTTRAISDDHISSIPYSEIFIGRLPRDLFEDELFPHLLQVGGTILKIRYMMDFSGSNRGFCFVKFANTQEAIRATIVLDGVVLRPDTSPIGVRISFDNKCLYFGNLPTSCTAEKLVFALQRAEIGGIVGARMADEQRSSSPRNAFQTQPFMNLNGNRFNQGAQPRHARPIGRFGYVYFESHDAATKARRLLMPNEVKIMNRKITLDWAKSELPVEIAEAINQIHNSFNARHQIQPIQRPTNSHRKLSRAQDEYLTHWSPRALCH